MSGKKEGSKPNFATGISFKKCNACKIDKGTAAAVSVRNRINTLQARNPAVLKHLNMYHQTNNNKISYNCDLEKKQREEMNNTRGNKWIDEFCNLSPEDQVVFGHPQNYKNYRERVEAEYAKQAEEQRINEEIEKRSKEITNNQKNNNENN